MLYFHSVDGTTGKKRRYMMQTALHDAHDAHNTTGDTCDAAMLQCKLTILPDESS